MARAEYVAAACEGKEKFDRATANMVARKSKTPVDTFKCRNCGHWHIGKARSGRSARRRRKSK